MAKRKKIDSDKIAREVERARALLSRLIAASGLQRQQVDDFLGVGHSYTSRLLTGNIRLTYDHILSILAALGVEPDEFFGLLHEPRRGAPRDSWMKLEQLLRQAGFGSIPEAPPPPPVSPDTLEEKIVQVVERILARRQPRS